MSEHLVGRWIENTQAEPSAMAYAFVSGPEDTEIVTRGELLARAHAISIAIRQHAKRGDRVVIALPQSFDFVYAFLGCLLAGCVAVPCNLPRNRSSQSQLRLKRIVDDASAILVITTDELVRGRMQAPLASDGELPFARQTVMSVAMLRESVTGTPGRETSPFAASVSEIPLLDRDVWLAADGVAADGVAVDEVALLQYTSGATGAPKGVVVTHANLAANQRAMQQALEHSSDSLLVSWLPFFHDMGLICGLLQPLYVGFPAVLMSPGLFLKQPELWLQAVTDYRATTTGGPNFAYDHCTDQITDEQLARLDLSSLVVAFNGAEPVRGATLERFSQRFAPAGFQRSMFFPCYGLAESTLIVSGGPPREPWIERQRDTGPTDRHATRALVGCGRIVSETEVAIVDPQSRVRLRDGAVGEVWVRGSSVARGYWNQPQASEQTFGATIANEESTPYLRTGDLGFLTDGQLFVSGRCKDMMIVRGRNIDPLDLEQLFLQTTSAGRINAVAAVAVDEADQERIYLLAEATSSARRAIRQHGQAGPVDELDRLANQIHAAIVAQFDVPLQGIAFVRPGRLPRTTSGKLARQACRTLVLDESSDVLYVARVADTGRAVQNALLEKLKMYLVGTPNASFASTQPDASLHSDSARVLRVDAAHTTSSTSWPFRLSERLSSSGLDSLARTSLFTDLEHQFQVSLLGRYQDHDPRWCDLLELLRREGQEPQVQGVAAEPARSQELGEHTMERQEARRRGAEQCGSPPYDSPPCDTSALTPDASCLAASTAGHQEPDSRNASFSDFEQRMSRDLLAKTRDFAPWLNRFDASGHKRYLLPVLEYRGGRALVGADRHFGNREVVLFGSADYLSLAHDPRLKLAATQTVIEQGCNVASVPLVAGMTEVHRELETELAEWLGKEACVLFPTGQSANSATIAALCSERDSIVVDSQVHCSILEGVRLSRSAWRTFLHNDPQNLEEVLKQVRQSNAERGVLVIVEGVYGIDGDLSSLRDLTNVARRYDARIMVDDAHGIGAIGANGRGTADTQQVTAEVDILMGSLSKSLGSFGGFVLASQDVINYLRFFAKSISFAVGMPAINAAVALEGVRIIRDEPQRVLELQRKAALLRSEFLRHGLQDVRASQSSIMSIEVGSEDRLRELSRELFERGVWAEPLPFPAVPRGKERLRFRVRYAHTDADLQVTAETVADCIERSGVPSHASRTVRPAAMLRRNGSSSLSSVANLPRWTVTDGVDSQEARELTDLIQMEARANCLALPWVSPELIAKYFSASDYWNGARGELQWNRLQMGGKTLAAFCVERQKVNFEGRRCETAMIGSFAYRSELLPELMTRLSMVSDQLRDQVELVAVPAMHPVFVFGAGVANWPSTDEKPFLEQTHPVEFQERLSRLEFEPLCELHYTRLQLAQQPLASNTSGVTTIREFRRDALAQEATWLTPIINRTLAKLPLGRRLEEPVVLGLLKDLRELIRPGFWLVAERQGRPVGFVFAYPNITNAFRLAYGNADIADFQALGQAMEEAREVFVAWLAVDPREAGQQISRELLDTLLDRVRGRGYRHAWLSWEMVDGTPVDSRQVRYGKIVQHVTLPVPGRRKPPTIAPDIPAPHLELQGKPSAASVPHVGQ
jgi:7-keto-8-aminopelargonate synthetase-like enzyme/acyl-CoA synthetase (AMP-forming)/AMP-acid ligase II/GNAT superfamily N-acetyltransferase